MGNARLIALAGLALGLISGVTIGAHTLGSSAADDQQAISREREESRAAARVSSERASFAGARKRGYDAGLEEGRKAGRTVGKHDGARAARSRLARRPQAAASTPSPPQPSVPRAEPSPGLAGDPAFEDDAGAYDPQPPPVGSYSDMNEFCRDQPEETECGGPGDPGE